jgi:hypothetical protein
MPTTREILDLLTPDEQPLRSLEAIRGDILALEKETDRLLVEIIGAGEGT